MILLFFCASLQILCVAERVINKVLTIFLTGSKVSDLRRMLDNLLLSGVFSFVLGLVLLPLQLVGIVLGLLLRNLVVSIWMLALVSMLVSVSESSSSVLSLFVNLYNAGVGGVVDMLVVKPLQLLDFVYRGVVPLYNSFFWMLSQLFSKVGLPFFGAHASLLMSPLKEPAAHGTHVSAPIVSTAAKTSNSQKFSVFLPSGNTIKTYRPVASQTCV